ncbi:MAG TPA: PqqD family protein [Pyrinomonadaceae bacterium]|nr:PqqD family protein [Pyrinomonadaceae bacterium]
MKQSSPVARSEFLIVKELLDETLVYDLKTDKAHCLNLTAARVWKSCDGHRTVSDLRARLEDESGVPVPEEVIGLALDQLKKFDLLENGTSGPARLAGLDRRRLVGRIGAAALALPVIFSIVAPAAKAQASDCFNANCNTAADCCPLAPICNPSFKCKRP